jgi:UDP-N-acetylmuramoyl-tripeptide--D-alanyl-D-alanine ligase
MKVEYPITSREIAERTGGAIVIGPDDVRVQYISSDSRDLPEKSLFVALKGERYDGHDFIDDLIAEGKVSAVLTMEDKRYPDSDTAIILCDDTLAALGRLAAFHRKQCKARVVAVTGTNGKTTTKELIYSILSSDRSSHRSEKNYNNEIGIPFSILGLPVDTENSVLELGMNHPGEIHRLSLMSMPDIAVITSIGEGHLEFLGTVEDVARAKGEILDGMKPGSLLICNGDTASVPLLLQMARDRGIKALTCGLEDRNDRIPETWSVDGDGVSLTWRGETYRVPLIGIHNIYNLFLSIIVSEELDIPVKHRSDGLQTFEGVPGRGGVIQGEHIIIDDTYNSNPLSVRYALHSIKQIYADSRHHVVLGDMLELGESAKRYHHETGALCARLGISGLYLMGEYAQDYAAGAREGGMNSDSVQVFDNHEELSRQLLENLEPGDVVLVKGSRGLAMEKIVEFLSKESA